eukprot:117565-Lingulodinium_polyedra.AAC.1
MSEGLPSPPRAARPVDFLACAGTAVRVVFRAVAPIRRGARRKHWPAASAIVPMHRRALARR